MHKSRDQVPQAGEGPGPWIDVDRETRLFYRDWGSGMPIVFLAAWGLNSDAWRLQMYDLASQGFRCIAYDRRGHGRSTDPGQGYEFDTLADDCAALIEQLDLHDVMLVGHSIGAAEIIRYLTRYGALRVSKIALIAPSTPFILRTADNPEGIDAAVIAETRSLFRKDLPKWLSDNVRPFLSIDTSSEFASWIIAQILQASFKALMDCNEAFATTDFRRELRDIQVPTLILQGDADCSAPIALTGRKTAQLIAHCQFKVYEGAPHGLIYTHADQVNAELAAFARG